MQLISGLRNAGHRVTFSMPLDNYLGKKNVDRVLPLLSKDELWACENFSEPDIVLNRMEPDIAITCNINTFRSQVRFARDIVQIVDLYGPVQLEGLLMDNPDYEAAMQSGPMLEDQCKHMIEKFRNVDYIVTVSERQKYFWAAYCSLAGFSFSELSLLVCPAAFAVPEVSRRPTPQLSVVYAGGFYPWQNPNRFLKAAAAVLERFEGAILHVFGGPHVGLVNDSDVISFLRELEKFRSVRYHGYRPVEEVTSQLAQAWCALEVMDRNIERELAITGRTIEFLTTGTPVLYNDYSTLSRLIEQYRAGWTISTEGEPQLEPIFTELVERGTPYLEELSANAHKLANEQFCAEKAIAPLAELCGSPDLRKRSAKTSAGVARKERTIGRVLALSPDPELLLDLRIRNPLRALHRQGLIDGFTAVDQWLHQLRGDQRLYHAILTQRAMPTHTYDVLEALALKFALDVDDNLLARACYRNSGAEFTLVRGLSQCAAVVAPQPRLVGALERYTGLELAKKSFIVPNALPFREHHMGRVPGQPAQIIWIQSDIAALAKSRDNVVEAVSEFSEKYELPIVLIGQSVLDQPQFLHQRVMGHIDFTSNLQMLAAAPLSLGVAPLETDSDHETLDFVAGKSDLKMVLFAGYGHCGVYSEAPPYTDSNLRAGLNVIGNSKAEWREALEYEYRQGWKDIAAKAREIQTERDMDKVAREAWYPALEAIRLENPVTGAQLFDAFESSFDMGRTPVKAFGYLTAHDDVLAHCLRDGNYSAYVHYDLHGKAERRQVRHNFRAHDELINRIEQAGSAVIADLEREIQRLEQLLQAERALSNAENAELKRTLSAVLQSKSWQVTAPLREWSMRGRSVFKGNGNSS